MKLVINNLLEGGLYYDFYDPNTREFVKRRRIERYDEEKWKDGTVYEFNTLKEMADFIESCYIEFTDDYANSFSDWDWEEIDIDYYIDTSEDNLMILLISSHNECRD